MNENEINAFNVSVHISGSGHMMICQKGHLPKLTYIINDESLKRVTEVMGNLGFLPDKKLDYSKHVEYITRSRVRHAWICDENML